MRPLATLFITASIFCTSQSRAQVAAAKTAVTSGTYVGFDNNEYPGDAALPILHQHFAFAGYWLNNPPGERHNSWQGKRDVLLRNGFGFMVLANGRLEAEIKKSKRTGVAPAALGAKDAEDAVSSRKARTLPHPHHHLSRSGRRRPPHRRSVRLPPRLDRGSRPLRLSSRRLRQRPARQRRARQDHHNNPGHPRTSRGAAPPRDRDVGLPGRLPPSQRLHHAAPATLRQRHARRHGMAVRTVSPPQGDHRILQQNLRLRRQLLRPRTP